MLLTRVILILFVVKAQALFSQQSHTDSLFLQFRQDVETEQGENAGRMILDDDTKESFYMLIHYSSVKALLKYTNDPNVYIRSSVFGGLLQKKIKKSVLERIIEEHRYDSALFKSKGGDVVIQWKMSEYMQLGFNTWLSGQLTKINYVQELEKLKAASMYKLELEGLRHGIMEKERLLKTEVLNLKDSTIKIVSFTLYTEDAEISCMDNRLGPEMKKWIEKTETRGLVIIDNIKVIGPDSKTWQMPGQVIRLK